MFRLNLLALSQSKTFKNSGNSFELISGVLDILEDKPVSSAYIDIIESFTKLGRFRIEPCGTAHVIFS